MNSFKDICVLHACPTWLPQTQTWIHSQVAGLQRLGINAHVVCNQTEHLDQFQVENIHCFTAEKSALQWAHRGLRKLRVLPRHSYVRLVAKRIRPTILHSHFGHLAWANLAAARESGAKHVVTFYGLDVNMKPLIEPVWRQRYRDLFSQADLFLCEGSHMARCLVDLGAPERKVHVQHLGVDVDRFEFKPRQWDGTPPLKVLIAASFREKKGIPYALDAIGRLNHEVPVELTVIGDAIKAAGSQSEKRRIMEALDATGLRTKTRLLGFQSHDEMLRQAYSHHIFVQPSVTAADGDTEGGAPVSIIEMIATGMPVVSTFHCDIPEVMGDDLQHLLVPERDSEALCRRLRDLVGQPERWMSIAAKGRYRIASEYNLKIQGERLVEVYAGLR